MKTRLISEFQKPLWPASTAAQTVVRIVVRILTVFAVVFCVMKISHASAEVMESTSLSAYETMLRQKKRDFERYIKSREKSSEAEAKAAKALHEARRAANEKRNRLEVQYQRTMKRYSMEEIEKRDREDEERLARKSVENNRERLAYVKKRNERRELKAEIAPVDSYKEFDINMAVEPESKASHTEVKGSQLEK